MRTIVVQKAIIVDDNGKILLLRRSETDVRRPRQWDLPGGLLDEGEEFADSILREIKEETALEVTDIQPVFSKTEIREWHDHDGGHTDNAIFIFYKAKARSVQVTLSYEHTEGKWIALEEAPTQFKYELHIEVLRHIIDNQLI